jgi:hypothetical protein
LKCKVCGEKAEKKFSSLIMNKYNADYYLCSRCGFLFADEPSWLNEAYKKPINLTDTGLVNRNIYFSQLVTVILYFFFDGKGKFLDYAGGYGLFTRLMRDNGFDFYWNDPYCTNLLAAGFEYDLKSDGKIELVTAFELLEHLPDPSEIKKILAISRNFLFSTQILPSPVPEPGKWEYYGLEHGQHVSFYSYESLRYIAKENNLSFYSTGGIHFFTEKKLNIFFIRFLLKFSGLGLVRFIKRRTGSKTEDDQLRMMMKEPD